MSENYIDSFFDYLSIEKKYSRHTILSYKHDLEQFQAYLLDIDPNTTFHHVNHQMIRGWMVDLVDKQIAARSINRKLSCLKSFYKFLQKQHIITVNPLQKITGPKTPKRLPEFVSEENMSDLFQNVEFEQNFEGQRDKLILDILYQTGIRRSELVHLKETDIDLIQLNIKVLGKRNKERIIPISLELKRNLESYLTVKKNEGYSNHMLFITKQNKILNDQAAYLIVKKYLSKITSIEKKSPHTLRHTFATHMLNHDADINAVKSILGHANLSATQIYTHNTIDKLKKSYKQAHPRGDKK